jgi:hypothetical protein
MSKGYMEINSLRFEFDGSKFLISDPSTNSEVIIHDFEADSLLRFLSLYLRKEN